jgi:hypothetical protein
MIMQRSGSNEKAPPDFPVAPFFKQCRTGYAAACFDIQ